MNRVIDVVRKGGIPIKVTVVVGAINITFALNKDGKVVETARWKPGAFKYDRANHWISKLEYHKAKKQVYGILCKTQPRPNQEHKGEQLKLF